MSVDITQEEMNILNLNGISADDVKYNVEFMRASGFDDGAIREQYNETLEKLKPITRTSVNDGKKIKEYQEKGGITPYEYAQRESSMLNLEFDGKYDNIVKPAQSQRGKEVEAQIQRNRQAKEERNKRVNEGTANFFERAGAALDRWGEASYQAQKEYAEQNKDKPYMTAPRESMGLEMVNERANRDKTQKIGIAEAIENGYLSGEYMPFVGGFLEDSDENAALKTQEKIMKGEPITQAELDFLNRTIEKKNEEKLRGYTYGGEITRNLLPALFRFSTEMAVGGWAFKALGLSGVGTAVGGGIEKILKAAKSGEKVVKTVGKVGKILTDANLFGALNAALPTTYNETYKFYQDRRFDKAFRFTEDGKAYFKENEEKPATSFMKSLLQTYLMFSTEAMGELIGMPVKYATGVASKYLVSPMGRYLASNKNLKKLMQETIPELSKAYEKLNNLEISGKNLDWLKSKVKFDGLIEEIGEEKLEDLLNLTFETGDEKRSLENYAKTFFGTPDEWAVLVGTIALQGGTLSVASHILGNYMERNGASDEEIVETILNLKEEGVQEKVLELAENGELNLDDYNSAEKQRERTVTQLSEKFQQEGSLLKNKNLSNALAELFTTSLEVFSKDNNKSLEEVIQKEMPKIIVNKSETLNTLQGYISKNNEEQAEESIPEVEEKRVINNRLGEIEKEFENLADEDFENGKFDELEAEYEKLTDLKNQGKIYYQEANTAGAESGEYLDAAKEWKEKGTDSQFFKKWSGNTPVIKSEEARSYDFKDGEGVTIDLFHSTRSVFDTFDHNKKGQSSDTARVGFWFADTEKFAENFAKDIWYGEQENPIVMHCFVTMKNPKVYEEKIVSKEEKEQAENRVNELENKIKELNQQFNKIIQETGSYAKATEAVEKPRELLKAELKEAKNIYAELRYTDAYEQLRTDIRKIEGGNAEDANFGGLGMYLKNQDTVEKFVESLKEQGYDGIIVKGTRFDSEAAETETNNQYAVFNPEQIKSVDNRGTFDSNNPNILYQREIENRNLVMAHASKSDNIDDILEAGSLVAPSFSITKKGQNELSKKHFGDILFIRKPETINFRTDNIFDRDIYSPRMPRPMYKLKNKSVIDSYEYESLQKKDDDYFKKNYGDTKENYLQVDKKVIFWGYDKNGYRQYKDYNSDNLLKYLKREGLVGGESWNYGLSSFLARLATKQTSLKELKKKSSELSDREEAKEEYEELSKEYTSILFGDLGKYYKFSGSSWQKISDDDFLEIMYAVAIDSKRKLSEYIDVDALPDELYKRMKNLTDRALKLPRSYFEAKPLRKVPLTDFAYALVENGTINKKQKDKLKEYGIKVVNYKKEELNNVLDKLDATKNKVYFQKDNSYNSFKEIEEEFKEYIEVAPEDYGINNLEDALKDLNITENTPRIVNTPVGNVSVRVSSIEHIINGGDSTLHKPDKNRYKSINRMFAVLERPEIITTDENGKKKYIKLFKSDGKTKSQIDVVYNDENGDFVYTTMPVDRDKRYVLNQINKGNVIYKKGQTGVNNNSAANNIITDNGTDFKSLKQDGNADAMKNVKGYYIPAEKMIVLLKNADASTIAHEWAHWYLDLLQNNSDNEIIAEKLEAVRKHVGNNGEPFTEEQHEKFARSFEVYLRSGYARNNKLKQVFEDFKNFLMSIYDSVMSIVYNEDGVNKTFTEDEIKNIKDIFDNLLTTERERIKSTVFDKIAEIDNKIEEIKNHEAEEFKELDSIWRDNIALMDRKSDKKRKVKEYIELAEKMTSRDTKEVREWKKRYKDATLDILAAVSGKSRSWVANSRNWEKLQDIIGGAGDEITTSGGFRAEWSEFYADTGVSYENDEIDGDYKLAEQAFRVMADGSYDRVYGEDYRFADIDNYIAKLDYLAAKVKTLKGTEKEAAFEAFCEVFGNMPEMPEEIAAEVAQKIPEMEEVYETQQRDDFNKKVYPSIPVVQQLQWYITNKLNELKVYNPETRYKMRLNRSHRLYRYIKNINSVDAAKKQIRRINEYVIDDMRNNQRSLLSKEIQKQIKVNSKVVKVGSLTKGKFDWKTNTVFAELVQLNKLSREEAEKQLGAMVNIDNAANSEARDSFDEADSGEFNKTGDFQAVLRNEFLQYRSQKLQDLDVTHTIQLLQDILELKEKGRKAKSEEDFLNKTQRWNTKNNLLDVLEETKLSGAQFGANWIAGVGRVAGLNGGVLANWESLLNAIFNRETAQKYSLLGDEARSEVYARRHMLHFYKKASDIYGFKSPSNWDKFIDFDYLQPIIDLMREYDNEKYTYTQKVFSINTPSGYAESSIEISRAQMITMFAWSLNDELEQRLFNQFGVQQIMDMFEGKLSKEDKELAWALVDTCETMREDINEVFIRTTGLSLPKVQNYFPSKAERVQSDIDLYHDFFVKSSNPSFIKERKSCHRIPMKPMAPLEILIPHINKTAKYVILSEKTNFMNQVFKDTAIKTKMQEIWGSDNGAKIYQTLINKLAACTFTNYAKGTNLVASALDTVSRNYISSRIGFSGKVALGQLLSVVNYAENMPAAAWAKGFKETIKHPIESFKYMLENCEYLQSRLAGNTQNEIISILTSEKDRFRKLRNFMSTNTKWGDIIAITLGGKPYVDYLMEQGMTKEEAFDKFLEDTLRAQQAGTTSSISEWQSAQAQNCLTRMIFAFQNTTIQYERKFIDTLIQAKKGELSKSEAAKKLFIYKILNPIMFTSFLGNLSLLALFRGLAGGDDDEPVGFLKSVIESIFLSGFGAYGFAGFFSSAVVESIIANLDSGYKHFDKAIPIYSDFNREIQKWVKGDLEFADYVEALAFASDYGAGVAGTKVINAAGGLGNIAQGQFGVGLTRMAGWGEYTSTKAWTGEEPERKKKKRK